MADKWAAPADLDPECLALCQAINDHVPGVITTESCCGHGREPYRIWVHPQLGPDALLPLLYRLDQCHTGLEGWRMEVYTDCGMSHVTWMIEGPPGAYAESEKIATFLAEDDAARHPAATS